MGKKLGTSMQYILFATVSCGVALLATSWLAGDPIEPMTSVEPATPLVQDASTPHDQPVSILLQPITAPTKTPPASGSLLLPDGTYLPALNGVSADLQMTWPTHIEFSPVIGRAIDSHGIERYQHADGSQSTTQMIFRSDLERPDAAVLMSRPQPTAPTRDEIGKRR